MSKTAGIAPRPCRRTNPHTPHGGCPGTAPEFPWERVEVVEVVEVVESQDAGSKT